ncbi:glycosyltransferase [Marivirga sp. S37H4]|uniref:Glycosyltransferase n=1 Tax=Marivirga aurantiaca TaxID=2802615 RepID=A0A935CAG3_9BACT|nr:glycosyltransferase [Marivirga aurantiaca]MBK6266529.1 glycosyltransferase [Marivirga aurantiaca]
MKINKGNIIIFALAKWNGTYSSTTFSLAEEFSKENKVLYVDPPMTWKDLIFNFNNKSLRDKIRRSTSRENTVLINKNLTAAYLPPVIPMNFLPKGKLYRFIKAINERIVFSSLQKIIKATGIDNYIYINSFNPFFDHSKYLHPILSIYYTVDNIAESAYIRKHGVWLEPEIMSGMDLTLATSLRLKKQNEKHAQNIFYLPNAVNLEIFDHEKQYEKPKELVSITTEIILFTGHLDKRTDIELVKSILKSHSNRTLVIIGPVSLKEEVLAKLNEYENIQFVDPKPIEQLPAYLQHSDCAIIPFRCNDLTKNIYPLKINEYLAMGIPVVSTIFSKDILGFNEVISLATQYDEFNEMIEKEIAGNSATKVGKRIHMAKKNTWPNRIKQFWEIISPYTPPIG